MSNAANADDSPSPETTPTRTLDAMAAKKSILSRIGGVQAFWIFMVLVVICVFFSVVAGDRFLSASNFSLISQNVAVWAVLGVGMTFIIITSGIDLSVGSVLVFASVISAKVMQAIGVKA